jgi:miniconductance mechanosensitive channel
MNTALSTLQAYFQNIGLGNTVSRILSIALCITAVTLLSSAIASLFVFITRTILVKKKNTLHHKEKMSSFCSAVSFMIFTWIVHAWLPDLLVQWAGAKQIVERILSIVSSLAIATVLTRGITWAQAVAYKKMSDKIYSSKTIAQTIKIIIWSSAAIIIVSSVMGKSPTFVLSGLGALTAVLMLIFRDSILGLVAGIQVSQNDMVRIGDWITMPKHNADGTVIDIALTTVKVQNFDNTVTMIPSSALISDSFINWRYMSISKGRRIKRAIWISASSICEMTPSFKKALVAEGLIEDSANHISNLTAFEAYLLKSLKSRNDISSELTCMVRQLSPTDTGIPVEVYAFTTTRDWVEYENIQTAIFDWLYITAPKFHLRIYQRTGDNSRFSYPEED